MKTFIYLFLLFAVFGSSSLISNAQSGITEIKKLVQGLSQSVAQNACDGKFTVRELRRSDDAIWYEVSYALKTKTAYRQTFKSSALDISVELTPIKADSCSVLFLNYSQGAIGDSQESYVIFPSPSKFSYLALSQASGYYSAEDLDGDGETEIITQKAEPSSDDTCNRFAYWGRIFHLNRISGKLIEMQGASYPKYYASLVNNLRNTYEYNKSNMSAKCRNTFLLLIKRAEELSKGKK